MATKLPSGKYRTLVYIGIDENGKRKYEQFVADSSEEANWLAKQFKNNKKHKSTVANLTLGEAIDRYIENKTNILSPKTVREYKLYRKNNAQMIMDIELCDLTTEIIQKEVNRESKKLAPKTIRNIYGIIITVLGTYAPDKKYHLAYPQKIKKEIVVPTEEQLKLIFESVVDTNFEIPVLLGACLGMRRSEISAIDLKKDIDYKNNKIKINKAMVKDSDNDWVLKSPKAYSSYRTLDVPPHIMEKLKKAHDNESYKIPTPASISSFFKRLTKRLNLENVRFHDLRHYFASIMLSLDIPDKYAMDLMGHATANMLKTVYQHLMDDKKAEVTKTVNAYFENIMQHDMQQKEKDIQ